MSTIRRPTALRLAAGLLVLLVGIPAAMSLSRGDGTVCVASSACGLSAINPCTRYPSFAVVGRCAFPLQRP
jgi:hypothetical protein